MISFIKNILTPKKMSGTEIVTDSCNDQSQMDAVKTTDPTTSMDQMDDDESEIVQSDVAKDSVSKSSDNSNDASESNTLTVKEYLNPRVMIIDCALKRNSNHVGSCVHKTNGFLSRRSQRKSAKVAAERISQIAEVCDTSLLTHVIRTPSQRICAKVAVRKIADIIDGSSESEEEKDVCEGDISE